MKLNLLKLSVLFFVASSIVALAPEANAAAKKSKSSSKAPVAEEPVDWNAKAAAELEAARAEVAKPDAKSKKAARETNKTGDTSTAKPVAESQPTSLTDTNASAVLPTPATIRAEVTGVDSVIERSALRFTFLFEPYQPHGEGRFASGEKINYGNVPGSVLGQIDLRWLPFDLGEVSGRHVSAGGYVAAGYSRQKLPLVAPSGFRYDDVALNTIRFEAGAAAGLVLNPKLNLELRAGVGRISNIQTSQYADVVGTTDRPYLVGAVDLAYHLIPRFALVASVARRTPLADGSGSIAFDPVTVSGGFLVQVR